MKETSTSSDSSVPILERALLILEHMLKHPKGLGISDITNQLGFPKNSVYRIVNTLWKHGYLSRDSETKRFILSRKLFSMAYNSAEEKGLIENSLDVMRELRDEVKETVLISIIADDEGLVLEQMPGLYPFRFVVEPGTRRTVYASSHGKAILASKPEDEREGIIGRIKFVRFTDRTIASVDELRDELERVRRRGFAFDLGEETEGVRCVSAPILDRHGLAMAAFTTTGPAFRMPDSELDAVGRRIREHADRVSRRFGYGLV